MHDHACQMCHIGLEHVGVVRDGQTLLKDVSMHIHCGQLTVLIGKNGAGKTTLIRALLGEIPSAGRIRHLDGEGRDFPRLRTGYVPQHLDFDREAPVTVLDFMAAAFSKRPVWTGVSARTRHQVEDALRSVRAAECSAAGESIFKHDPKGKVAEAYRSLTTEVIRDDTRRRKRALEPIL